MSDFKGRKSRLSGPPWPGGKSARATYSLGAWIVNQLPYRDRYCEPFSGMLGVLLQREPSKVEVVNDLDGSVANFWRVIQRWPERLQEMLNATPVWSRNLGIEAKSIYVNGDPDPVLWAWGTVLTCYWGISMGGSTASLRTPYRGNIFRSGRVWELRTGQIAERMRRVCVEQKDAVVVTGDMAKRADTVIYIDPPYAKVSGLYSTEVFDRDALSVILSEAKAAVAISGYNDEWDGLGWRRLEFPVKSKVSPGKFEPRVEVLWCNYD